MLLIKNAKIYTMTGVNYESGDILIEGKKIKQIGKCIKAPKNCEVLDVKGAFTMPGLIDAHCHIGIHEQDMGFEGLDENEMSDSVTPQMRAIDGINPMDTSFDEAIKAGITSVMTGPGSANVIGGQFAFIKTKGKCIDDMIMLAPAAMKIAFGENPKAIYKNKNKMPMTRMAIAALLRENLIKAKNYKTKKQNALEKGEFFEKDIKMEALLPVIERKIPLKAHAHRADDILTAIRIAKEFNLKLTLDHCTEGHLICDEVKKSKFPAIVGPTLSRRSKIELKNKTFKTPYKLYNFGVKIAIMTDHPVIPIEYLPICAGFAVKEGLPMEEALKAITINAAKICGVEERVGSLEVQKDADIAIFDGNPMEVFTKTLYTIIDGKVVFKRE